MAGNRASIFDTEDDALDVSGFAPKTSQEKPAPSPAEVKAVSEAANFTSRQPAKSAERPQRRATRTRITGRSRQFNVKATAATIEAFYALSDRQGWVLGETLEHALAALERELNGKGQGKIS